MKASFWRLAAACCVLIGIAVSSAPYALTADMTLTTCQTIQEETRLANQYGWVEVKAITGDVLAMFMSKYNAEPPVTNTKADEIHFFKKQGVSQIGIVLVLGGCVIKREFMGPAMVEKLLGAVL